MISSKEVLDTKLRLGYKLISGNFCNGYGCCPLSMVYAGRTGRIPNCTDDFVKEVTAYFQFNVEEFYAGFDGRGNRYITKSQREFDCGKQMRKELDDHISTGPRG